MEVDGPPASPGLSGEALGISYMEDRRLPDGRIEKVIRRKTVLPAEGDGEVLAVMDRAEAERDG